MSDVQPDPSWWQAADGRWYPAEAYPHAAPSSRPVLPQAPADLLDGIGSATAPPSHEPMPEAPAGHAWSPASPATGPSPSGQLPTPPGFIPAQPPPTSGGADVGSRDQTSALRRLAAAPKPTGPILIPLGFLFVVLGIGITAATYMNAASRAEGGGYRIFYGMIAGGALLMLNGMRTAGPLARLFVVVSGAAGAVVLVMAVTGDLGDRLYDLANGRDADTIELEECLLEEQSVRTWLEVWRSEVGGNAEYPASLDELQDLRVGTLAPRPIERDWGYSTTGEEYALATTC